MASKNSRMLQPRLFPMEASERARIEHDIAQVEIELIKLEKERASVAAEFSRRQNAMKDRRNALVKALIEENEEHGS